MTDTHDDVTCDCACAERADVWKDTAGYWRGLYHDSEQHIEQLRQPRKTDRGVIVYAALLVALVLFLTFTAGYWYRSTTRPMPCTETQVYVWADYPNDARCVSNIDHAAHSGETHR